MLRQYLAENRIGLAVEFDLTPRVTGAGDQAMQLPLGLKTAGKVLKPALTIGIGKSPVDFSAPASGPLNLPVPQSSLVVFEAVAE